MKKNCLKLLAVSAASLLSGLAGCGGGSGPAPDFVTSQTKTAPLFVTVPEYQVLRSEAIVVAGGELPSIAQAAGLVAANYQLAVAQLNSQLSLSVGAYGGNQAVAPPLTYAVVRTLGAAATGASLAQISNTFNLTPTPFVAAQQTSRVTSQLWADTGHKFHTEFMAALDMRGPFPRLSSWSASEAGFAMGDPANDASLMLTIADAYPAGNTSYTGGIGDLANVRLLVSHSLNPTVSWGAVTAFSGVFQGEGSNNFLRLPVLRITQGVHRFTGAGFTADMLKSGDLNLMTLRPATGTLTDFARNALEPALAEAAQALTGNSAAPVIGEMVLPGVDMQLRVEANRPIVDGGAFLVYDEVNASLQGLDQGGTYVKMARPWASLKIASDGLALQARHSMAFAFSPRNIFGPYGAGLDSVHLTAVATQTCVWPTLVPDLRPFFLLLLDAQGWVVSMAAIQAPPGVQVQPVCTPTVPVTIPFVPVVVTPVP